MKVAVMQPYFLPYLGYFQLINAVDIFVIYDNIKFTKKGWINRNNMLEHGKSNLFSLPLMKASDFSNIDERELSADFDTHSSKLLRKIRSNYSKAPFFDDTFPFIQHILAYDDRNLFKFVKNSLVEVCSKLGISTEIMDSSQIAIDHELRSAKRVIAICKELKATEYINPPGGKTLYSKEEFHQEGLELKFLDPQLNEYDQLGKPFVKGLSILDIMMFNTVDEIQTMLADYEYS